MTAFLPHKQNGPMVEKIRLAQLETDELTEYKGSWKNLFFFAGGYSAEGSISYSSKCNALKDQTRLLKLTSEAPDTLYSKYIFDKHNIRVNINTITHAIAMPAQ